MNPEIIFDVSRLCRRAREDVATGVDRVEQAYAQHFLTDPRHRVRFVARGVRGFRQVPSERVKSILARMQRRGTELPIERSGAFPRLTRTLETQYARARGLVEEALFSLRGLQRDKSAIYVNVGHTNLNDPSAIKRLLARHNAGFVAMIHDIIPISHPEYSKPGEAERHRRRLTTVSRFADAVIANSGSTAVTLEAYWRSRQQRVPPTLVAPLGLSVAPQAAPAPTMGTEAEPYFVVLGTIEPRKNHVLLLNLWRRLAQRGNEPIPKLLIVGRRGWENEHVIDMLERCSAIHPHVREISGMKDTELQATLRGARALLFPTFAEGYGLPLAEALTLGVPAICSDLGALREVGAGVPEFIDPLDANGWLKAIKNYTQPDSRRRKAQLARLRQWRAPNWTEHFEQLPLALELASPVSAAQRRMGRLPDFLPAPLPSFGSKLSPAE